LYQLWTWIEVDVKGINDRLAIISQSLSYIQELVEIRSILGKATFQAF
jgi:hypothetical protein